METLHSILVPVDGSAPSLAALDHAIALALDYGANVDVLHVVPTEDPLGPDARAEDERAMDAAYEQARDQLGDRLSRHTVTGDPVQEIVDAAGGDIDIIVLGTHGRIGRLRQFLGSVAEGVIRNAPCPVLTVRDRSEGYQSFSERRHGRPTLGETPAHAH
ncbi:MAG: universal stress protein [Kofleriaceae bacterium]|nr:universal stress protein [Kofleriaceae bacterium]